MHTILDILKKSTQYLEQKQIEQPRRQAEEVISDALNLRRIELYLNFEKPISEDEIILCRNAIEKRGKRVPSQYIRGLVDFYECQLKVTPDVLIPRHETEILVDLIVKALSKENLDGKKFWDICCGSGCIGIAIKKKFPNLDVTLSDISPQALEIAKDNAAVNQVAVNFVLGDLMKPFAGQKADFIACNPPYISEGEFTELQPEVRDFEPKQALVAGPTGLEVYRKLSCDLPPCLHPKAKVWLEMGYLQGNALVSLFNDPIWSQANIKSDWSGKERFFLLEIE